MGNGEDLFLILTQQLVLTANSKRSVKVLDMGDPMEEDDTCWIPKTASESLNVPASRERYSKHKWLRPAR